MDDWKAEKNTATANDGLCGSLEDPGFFTSGIGIAVLGGNKITLKHNAVTDNVADAGLSSEASVPPGGISIISSLGFGGSDPTNVKVEDNKLSANSPFDIFWDGSGSGNSFKHNHCSSSLPGGLCS